MTPEKPMKDGSQRQKIMIVVTVIIFLIVAYNVIGLFRGGSSTPTTQTAATPTNNLANKSAGTNPSAGGGLPATSAPATATNNLQPLAPTMTEPRQARISQNSEIARLQAQTQTEYLSDLNNLQILKVQREIAETKQAIAAAKLATITAETSIADSLISSTTRGVPQPEPELNAANGVQIPAAPAAPMGPIVKYSLMSVSLQGSKWTAVIKADSQLLDVKVDDLLPDGSVVMSINKGGVLIKKDTVTTKLVLSNAI